MSKSVEPIVSPSVHKRRVNDLIYESLSDHLRSEPIGFFCECPSSRCFETVWLSAPEYQAGRRNARWRVRSPGHSWTETEDVFGEPRLERVRDRYAGRSRRDASADVIARANS